jgi:hypothetical protein
MPRLELKSSQTFLIIKRCHSGQKKLGSVRVSQIAPNMGCVQRVDLWIFMHVILEMGTSPHF